MSGLKKKFEAASFRHEDVTVCLNGDLASKRDELLVKLADVAAPERLGLDPAAEVRAELDAVTEQMREHLATIRVYAMATDAWNAMILAHKPRQGADLDAKKGYNIVAVTKGAVEAGGVLLNDDGSVEPVAADEWPELWTKIDGGDFDRFWSAITRLNETNGWTGVDYLKKGSTTTPDSSGT